MMATTDHHRRIEVVRSMVRDLAERAVSDGSVRVPNTPAWTVGEVATHVGWALTFWRHMMDSPPDDSTARDRALAGTPPFPSNLGPDEVMDRIEPVLSYLADGEDIECYVSMTGGPGTRGLWARHALAEIGVHQMDVEAALGVPHSLSPESAADAADYVATAVLPAFRRMTGEDPGALVIELSDGAGPVTICVDSGVAADPVTIRGPGQQVLLALWGRPHSDVDVIGGDPAVWAAWQSLPSRSFQFASED